MEEEEEEEKKKTIMAECNFVNALEVGELLHRVCFLLGFSSVPPPQCSVVTSTHHTPASPSTHVHVHQ